MSGIPRLKRTVCYAKQPWLLLASRSGEEVLELTKEAQGRGHIVSLKNGLLTTPEMANIELGIMTKADHMVSQKDFFVDSNRAIKG